MFCWFILRHILSIFVNAGAYITTAAGAGELSCRIVCEGGGPLTSLVIYQDLFARLRDPQGPGGPRKDPK